MDRQVVHDEMEQISWDPYFKAYMTLADVYRYPTQHCEHHRRQLTLGAPDMQPGVAWPATGRGHDTSCYCRAP